MKYIKGDLIKLAKEGQFDVIVHGCNCFNSMGAGIAVAVRKQFPQAYEADLATKKGDPAKIGTYSQATVGAVTVVNAYTQFNFWEERDLFEYEGFEKILAQMKSEFKGKRIGFPLIGCGLAGGDYNKIMGMIETGLSGEDVTIVEWDQA